LVCQMFNYVGKIIFWFGEVAEWSNVPDSKSGVPQGTAGSNPALSAMGRLAGYFE
jgi:hypothetical protein